MDHETTGHSPTTHQPARWHQHLEGAVTSARADRWNSLVAAVLHVHDQASTVGLPLPRQLIHWQRWVIPVGRLSFPTGPTVIHLTP
jgi:hypothetical protein